MNRDNWEPFYTILPRKLAEGGIACMTHVWRETTTNWAGLEEYVYHKRSPIEIDDDSTIFVKNSSPVSQRPNRPPPPPKPPKKTKEVVCDLCGTTDCVKYADYINSSSYRSIKHRSSATIMHMLDRTCEGRVQSNVIKRIFNQHTTGSTGPR